LGYGTEGAIHLIKKRKLLKRKIVARAMRKNLAFIRFMEKAGLKFFKEFWAEKKPHSGLPDLLYELNP
tara:strand:- start:2329 stop:2532 length:204 start_codon:yes stop_codon:yes gene_type:complete